ncbi:MAG: MFS transporter [Acidimicrobiales bacterium]
MPRPGPARPGREGTVPKAGAAGAPARSPGLVLAVVGFGAFVAADDLTVVSTMLRPIISDLGIVLPDGLDDAAWIVNAYLIAFVATMPLAGKLSDLIGRRLTFVSALAVFAAGSALIPSSHSFGPFLVGRVLTAIGGGALVPVGMAVVGDVYAERARARALGTLGAIETLGWVWGPIYGAVLVRYLTWQWQFWLNVPLAVAGMVAGWLVLAPGRSEEVGAVAIDTAEPGGTRGDAIAGPGRQGRGRTDWVGAVALVVGLVAVNVALLGRAQIQSVTGLDQLTGSGGVGGPWLYAVAALAFALFVARERRSADPILDVSLFRARNLRAAMAVNFLVGGALVIAMVQVPLWINVVELDTGRSAVRAAQVLTGLTAAMAVASWAGGHLTARWWYRPPILAGLVAGLAGFAVMGTVWSTATPYVAMAATLALVGAGLGLVIAPTSAAVVDHAPPDQRGAAAGLVMLFRLMGLSVGLSGLTAWGLHRFNELRRGLTLPPLTDPGFKAAVEEAQASITTAAIGEMFAATTVVMAVALAVALTMRRPGGGSTTPPGPGDGRRPPPGEG